MNTRTNSSKNIVLKPETVYEMKFIGNLNVVGGRIFFEVSEPDREKNDYSTGIYQLTEGKAAKFTRGDKDYGFVADRTGNYIAYESKLGEKTAVNVRDFSTGVDFEVAEIDGRIIKKEWDGNSSGLYMIVEAERKAEDFRIIENIPLFSDERGFLEGLSYKLLHLRRNGRFRVIMEGREEIRDFAVNPVKKEIAVEIRPLDSDSYHSKVGILSLETGRVNYITSQSGEYIRPGSIGGITSMEYFDDGTLAFLLNRNEFFIEEAPEIVFWKDGKFNEILRKYDISPGIALSTDSTMVSSRLMRIRGRYLYFVATVHGRAGIYRVNDEGEMSPVVTGDFSVESFDFDGNDIYFIAQKSDALPQIYRYDGKASLLFSMNNREMEWRFRRPENFHFRASDGADIEGWFLRGKGKGTVVRIHGGPRGAFGEALVFEAHLLNSVGFNVIYCNPRGSDSYGDAFAAAVVKKYGERDYEDIMEMVDYSVKNFGIDPEHIGVTGGSYGGYMVNWIVGHTDRFKAAVSDRSFSDAVSDYFSGDIGPTFDSDQIGGTPYENLETYWEKSPIKHIRNCKTPLLLIQNDSDYRCPVWQAYELFTQLKMQGTVTKLVVFKGENHNLPFSGKPKNRVKRLEEIVGWFQRYLL